MTEVDSLPTTTPNLTNNGIGNKADQQVVGQDNQRETIKQEAEEPKPSVETSNEDEKPKKDSPTSALAPPPVKNPWTRNARPTEEGKKLTILSSSGRCTWL